MAHDVAAYSKLHQCIDSSLNEHVLILKLKLCSHSSMITDYTLVIGQSQSAYIIVVIAGVCWLACDSMSDVVKTCQPMISDSFSLHEIESREQFRCRNNDGVKL